jgi:hypothetical protein
MTLPKLLTPEEVAAYLGLEQVRTLADWRLRRMGPAYLKCGRAVRYREADIIAWMDAQAKQTAGAA